MFNFRCSFIQINKLDWMILSSNPNAIQLLGQNPDKINWTYLSINPAAIELLKENTEEEDAYIRDAGSFG